MVVYVPIGVWVVFFGVWGSHPFPWAFMAGSVRGPRDPAEGSLQLVAGVSRAERFCKRSGSWDSQKTCKEESVCWFSWLIWLVDWLVDWLFVCSCSLIGEKTWLQVPLDNFEGQCGPDKGKASFSVRSNS